MELTIIIPTLARPEFVIRLLEYYVSQSFAGYIIVADSSDEADFRKVSDWFLGRKLGFEVLHMPAPGCTVSEAVEKAGAAVRTRYACLLPDDDFIVPAGAEKCIAFLDAHKDYTAAHGEGFLLSSDNTTGELVGLSRYLQCTREEETGAERLGKHLADYKVNLFAVHRVEVWRRMFSSALDEVGTPPGWDKTFSDELLPCCLSVVHGKIAQLPSPYLVRQVHAGRYLLPDWFSWIKRPAWAGSYAVFQQTLAKDMAECDGLALEDALGCVDRAFFVYIGRCARAGTPPAHGAWKNRLRNIPGVRAAWRRLQAVRALMSPKALITLESVYSRHSPYHDQLHPIIAHVRGWRPRRTSP